MHLPQSAERIFEAIVATRATAPPRGWWEPWTPFGGMLAAVVTFAGLWWLQRRQWRNEWSDRLGRETREREERLETRYRFEFARWAASVQRHLLAQRNHAEAVHREELGFVDAVHTVGPGQKNSEELLDVAMRPYREAVAKRKRLVADAAFRMRAASVRLHALRSDAGLRTWASGIEKRGSVDTSGTPTEWFKRIDDEKKAIDDEIMARIDALPTMEEAVAAVRHKG